MVTAYPQLGSKGRCLLLFSFLSSFYTLWDPSDRVDGATHCQHGSSHPLNKPIQIPHRHIQRCVSIVIPNPCNLTINTNHRSKTTLPSSGVRTKTVMSFVSSVFRHLSLLSIAMLRYHDQGNF